MGDHGAENIDAQSEAHKRGNIGVIIRRRDFDHLHAAETLGGDEADELERFAREQTAGLGPTSARDERRFDAIDIIRQINRIAILPGALEINLADLIDAQTLKVVHRHDICLS